MLPILLSVVVISLSGVMMPGPMLALVVGAVSAEGFWAAPIVQWEKNYPIRGWIHRGRPRRAAATS